jgi:hypothetical protein
MAGKSKWKRWALIAWGIAAVLVAVIIARPDSQPTPAEAAAAATADDSCRQDLQCWGKRHNASASMDCLSAIDRETGNRARWDDGVDLKLRYHRWLDREKGTLVYYGEALSLPDPKGQMVRQRFECEYDPAAGKLTDLTIKPAAG